MDNNSPKIIADVFLKRLDLLVSRLSDVNSLSTQL